MGGGELHLKIEGLPITNSSHYKRAPFGKEMLKQFLVDPTYKNLNHGSFGTIPRAILQKQRSFQEQCEGQVDIFIRYTYPKLVDESRAAIAKILNAPMETVVFVPNATTGVNTVLRNIVWARDGRDEIIYFKHIYGACLKTIEYVCEANQNIVLPREIVVNYPMEDSDLLSLFKDTVKASRAAGKNPRIAIFDTVSSIPGLRMPFEGLTKICAEEGVLSLVDGAHGVGHVHLDLASLNPDFFVSNAHKWLFTPRGCAVFYVPLRNQDLMRTSLPTSHGFVPVPRKGVSAARNPLPASTKSEFVNQFEFTGTFDVSSYLCIPEAIKWREEVCGGEAAIISYVSDLAREGGRAVAKILGTSVLDNSTNTLTDCCLVNVLLPLKTSPFKIAGENTVKAEDGEAAFEWMTFIMMEEYKTFLPIYHFQDQWWVRLSGQVYLDMDDFEWAGKILKEICDRTGNDEFSK